MTKRKTPLEKLGVRINLSDPVEGYKRNPSVRTRRGRVVYSAKEAKRRIKNDNLKDQVKKMRKYFGPLFKPESGYRLRDVEKWTPAMKAKVTRYWQVIAPQAARTHKAKYYKDKENLDAAVMYTQQEKPLKGQRAALFSAAPGETLDVKVKRGKVNVKRFNRVEVRKVNFDPDKMLADPIGAGREALAQMPGAKLYKLMFGPHESRGTFKSPDAVLNSMAYFMGRYSDDDYDPDDSFSHHYGNWLGGVIGYYGRRDTVEKQVAAEHVARVASVTYRKRERARRREAIRRHIIKQAGDKQHPKKKRKKKGKRK